ncbi:WD40-repeat-containing domain protein [Scenedesmus sp. NREL 46B-D3]|nr:WD40-repeat-containing domain protein [Scenedesmus sp. NREL 46B-D3]
MLTTSLPLITCGCTPAKQCLCYCGLRFTHAFPLHSTLQCNRTTLSTALWLAVQCMYKAATPSSTHVLHPCLSLHACRLGLSSFLQPAAGPCSPKLLSWHCNQQQLAVGHANSGAVLLYDLSTGAAAAAVNDAGSGVQGQAQQVLTHQLQQQVGCLAWRPVHCSMLAVGCLGGVALWSLGKAPLAAGSMHRGGENGGAGGTASSAAQSGWVTFLQHKHGCRVSSLSWSPDGRLLAGSSSDCSRVVVWDVALGVGASLRLGLQPITCLEWSPDGAYLFAAALSGRFFLYETTTWSLRSWDTPPGSAVTAAAWAPDASAVLLALRGSSQLVALYLVGQPPNLTEQLLPVSLPGVSDAQQ